MTVVTVTPNPALDLTYVVDQLRPGQMHRVRSVASRAGGKGLNVARVLSALDVPVIATGIVGGPDGGALRTAVRELGMDDALVSVDVHTRRTVTVVDRSAGNATLLNEPGPELDDEHWRRLRHRVEELLTAADVVTISGSLPPGVTPEALADLASTVSAAGVPVVVDTSGPALAAVARARPSPGTPVVKPNADELREATGISHPMRAATALRTEIGGAVVASLGAEGLLAVTEQGAWSARLPEPLTGNPTGAGDSVVAALAMGIRSGALWPDMLREACALSAATVLAPVAGEYDAAAYARFRTTVDVREVPM